MGNSASRTVIIEEEAEVEIETTDRTTVNEIAHIPTIVPITTNSGTNNNPITINHHTTTATVDLPTTITAIVVHPTTIIVTNINSSRDVMMMTAAIEEVLVTNLTNPATVCLWLTVLSHPFVH